MDNLTYAIAVFFTLNEEASKEALVNYLKCKSECTDEQIEKGYQYYLKLKQTSSH